LIINVKAAKAANVIPKKSNLSCLVDVFIF